MNKPSISVKIYNDTYVLRTDAPKEQVLSIAKEVDQRMQRLAESKQIQSTEKVAVWTALNLAADLQQLRQRYDALVAAVRER